MEKKKSKQKQKKVSKKSMPFEVADIRVSYGMTLNIGNYESFRADAAVSIRANKSCETIEEANELKAEMYAEGWGIVKEQLRSQVKMVRESTKAKEGE